MARDGTASGRGPPSSLFATPIRFRPNTITPNINVRMLSGGTLAGLVADTAGRRLSRVCVSAASPDQPAPTLSGTFGATTKGGRYLISNLPPGPYDLSFGCGGYGTQFFPSQPDPETSSLIAVNAGVTTKVNARLSRAGAISGTLTRSGGKPLKNACVEATPAGKRTEFFPVGSAFTSQTGHYLLGGLAPGRYLVQFSDCFETGLSGSQWYRRQPAESAATPVKVIPGRTDRGINGVIAAAGSITGRVTGPSGKPAKAVCVAAFSTTTQDAVFGGRTGKLGRYRINGLSTGRWSLKFSPCFNSKPDLGSLTLSGIHVTAPHTVTGVSLRMPAGGSISGIVVTRAGRTPISGPRREPCACPPAAGWPGSTAR